MPATRSFSVRAVDSPRITQYYYYTDTRVVYNVRLRAPGGR